METDVKTTIKPTKTTVKKAKTTIKPKAKPKVKPIKKKVPAKKKVIKKPKAKVTKPKKKIVKKKVVKKKVKPKVKKPKAKPKPKPKKKKIVKKKVVAKKKPKVKKKLKPKTKKKKSRAKVKEPKPKFVRIIDYKIIVVSDRKKFNKQQNKTKAFLSNFFVYEEHAIEKFNKLVEENQKNVKFPRQVINIHTRKNNVNEIRPNTAEILLIKKKRTEEDVPLIDKNPITGELTETKTNKEDWIIIKKHIWLIEETFWLYGYNPLSERKTYNYIFENIICKNKNERTITVFLNKVLIDYGNDFDFIVCKTTDEAIRYYNTLKKDTRGMDNIYFLGFLSPSVRAEIVRRLMEKTGWNHAKINRYSTRP